MPTGRWFLPHILSVYFVFVAIQFFIIVSAVFVFVASSLFNNVFQYSFMNVKFQLLKIFVSHFVKRSLILWHVSLYRGCEVLARTSSQISNLFPLYDPHSFNSSTPSVSEKNYVIVPMNHKVLRHSFMSVMQFYLSYLS